MKNIFTFNFEYKGEIMSLEIERKFLVKSIPDNLGDYEKLDISQGYIVAEKDISVRVRKMNEKFIQAIKTGQGKIREEVEIDLTEEQFNLLWPLTKGRVVNKTRYKIPHGDLVFELDFYHGDLEGLVTLEVEFVSEDASLVWEPTEMFGKEITEDSRYVNQNLAIYGKPEKE